MKKYISFAILMAFMSLAFSSCSKDEDDDTCKIYDGGASAVGYLVDFSNSSMDNAHRLLSGEWGIDVSNYDRKGNWTENVVTQISISNDGKKVTVEHNDGTHVASNIQKESTDGEKATIVTDNLTILEFKRILVDRVKLNKGRYVECGVVLVESKQPVRYLILSKEVTDEAIDAYKSTLQTMYKKYYTDTAFEAYFGIKAESIVPPLKPTPQ